MLYCSLPGYVLKVPRDDVRGRDLALPVGLERLLHAVLARVGRRVVAQQRGDLAVARVDALRRRQVHARDHEVAVGRVGEARVVQPHLQRRVVELGRAHLAQRVPPLNSHGALDEAHVHLGAGPTTLPSLPDFCELTAVQNWPSSVAMSSMPQRSPPSRSSPSPCRAPPAAGSTSKSAMRAASVSHFCASSAPLCVPSCSSPVAVVARLDVRLVGAAQAHLARVEAADAQPVVRVHRDAVESWPVAPPSSRAARAVRATAAASWIKAAARSSRSRLAASSSSVELHRGLRHGPSSPSCLLLLLASSPRPPPPKIAPRPWRPRCVVRLLLQRSRRRPRGSLFSAASASRSSRPVRRDLVSDSPCFLPSPKYSLASSSSVRRPQLGLGHVPQVTRDPLLHLGHGSSSGSSSSSRRTHHTSGQVAERG